MTTGELVKSIYFKILEKPIGLMCCFGLFAIVKDLNTWVSVKTTPIFSNASAAFIEEAVRLLSMYIGGTVAIVFSPFLAVVEFFMYINRETNLTHDFVAMRLVCIGIHMTCFFIQYFLYNKYKMTYDTGYVKLAYLSAVLVHLSYNTFLAYFMHQGVLKLYLS